MSTKIYVAWRWHRCHGLFDMTRRINEAAREEIRLILRKTVRDAKIEDNKQVRYEILQHLCQHIRVAAVSTLRDVYDINYRFMVKRAASYFLCMPTNQHRDYKFLAGIPYLETYPYWDNTDRPDGVSQRAWNARGKFWAKYWLPGANTIEFSPLCQEDPFPDLRPILVPDLFGKKQLSKNYWKDKNKEQK
jgi:hypothetical protein